jgi:hypothetical protein
MKKKIFISSIILFFVPLAITLLQGCITSTPCPAKPKYFEINKMYALPIFTYERDRVYQNEPISPYAIMFWLKKDVRYYSFNYQNSGGYNLMACYQEPPVSKETITNIEIFSDKDFRGFPAGTNLASLFMIRNLNRDNSIIYHLHEKPKFGEYTYLYFMDNAKPVSGIHQFKIIFTDSKNTVFEMNTEVNFK